MDELEAWRVVDDQRAVVSDLLEGLSPDQWAAESLCAGWTVKDVAAHLSMAATSTLATSLLEAARSGFRFDRMIHDYAVRRAAARSTGQVVADLRGTIGSRRLAPTTVWRDPLLDIVVHGQDIARPLGLVLPMPVAASAESAEWVWRRRSPFFAARRLRGLRLVADDVDWARGSGAELRGPIGSLLLLSTGRMVALDDLHGPGMPVARALAG